MIRDAPVEQLTAAIGREMLDPLHASPAADPPRTPLRRHGPVFIAIGATIDLFE